MSVGLMVSPDLWHLDRVAYLPLGKIRPVKNWLPHVVLNSWTLLHLFLPVPEAEVDVGPLIYLWLSRRNPGLSWGHTWRLRL